MLFSSFMAVSIVFNSFVLPFPAITQISSDEGHEETEELVQNETEDVTAFSSGREQTSWTKLFPDSFGDYFEIFAFLVHRKWHHELIDAIQTVGDEVENVEEKLDRMILQRAELQRQMPPITVKAMLPPDCIRKSELLNVI